MRISYAKILRSQEEKFGIPNFLSYTKVGHFSAHKCDEPSKEILNNVQ